MKLMFVGSSLSLLLYVIFTPIQELKTLNQARAAMQSGHFEQAMRYVDQTRQSQPQFYAAEATALCGDVILAQARKLADGSEPDFVGAVALARSLASRCDTTERDGEVAHLVEQVATQHLAWATARCQQQDYTGALTALQHLATLPYPERSLTQAHEEAAWCHLAFANALAQQKLFEVALEQLQRVASLDSSLVRATALQQVQPIVAEEIETWLQRQHYVQAFQQLGKYQQWFAADPATASHLADLESHVEHQVFGVALGRSCRGTVLPQREPVQTVQHRPGKAGKQGKAQKAAGTPPGPVAVATTLGTGIPEDAQPANLALRNTTTHRLRVLLRGPEPRNVLLDTQAQDVLQLAPAEYVVGVYAPEDCRVRPARSVWTIREWGLLRVEFFQDKGDGDAPGTLRTVRSTPVVK